MNRAHLKAAYLPLSSTSTQTINYIIYFMADTASLYNKNSLYSWVIRISEMFELLIAPYFFSIGIVRQTEIGYGYFYQ